MEYCSLTDIQKATRYLYLLKTSFGSKGKTFSVLRGMSLDNTTEYLEKIHERLKKVTIKNRDFEKIIKQYDREETLFYLDPPYLGSEKEYDITFSLEDHNRLFETLKNIKGKFVLSYNDADYIKDMYKDYNVFMDNSMSKNRDEKYKEVIIRNF